MQDKDCVKFNASAIRVPCDGLYPHAVRLFTPERFHCVHDAHPLPVFDSKCHLGVILEDREGRTFLSTSVLVLGAEFYKVLVGTKPAREGKELKHYGVGLALGTSTRGTLQCAVTGNIAKLYLLYFCNCHIH